MSVLTREVFGPIQLGLLVEVSIRARQVLARIAFVLGVGLCVLSGFLYSDLVDSYLACADGWRSPSIGEQGACSHHGGVERFVNDDRTFYQKVIDRGLIVFAVLLIGASRMLFVDECSPTRVITENNKNFVKLTIGGSTKKIEVVNIEQGWLRTADQVALFRCPDRKRKTVYKRPIYLRGSEGRYRPLFMQWIYTGRGRYKGYYAEAFDWIDG